MYYNYLQWQLHTRPLTSTANRQLSSTATTKRRLNCRARTFTKLHNDISLIYGNAWHTATWFTAAAAADIRTLSLKNNTLQITAWWK